MRRRREQSAAYDGPLIYIGRGAALIGVPARHLTAEEAARHGGAAALIASGLYASPIGDLPHAAGNEETSGADESAPVEEAGDGDGS